MIYVWHKGCEDLVDVDVIRREVFVNEQGVTYERVSEGDDTSLHLVLYEQDIPVATGRISNDFALQRIAVVESRRGEGLGKLVTEMLLKKAFEMGATEVTLSSQTHAKGFYEIMGFKPCSQTYFDSGIEHLKMKLKRQN